MSEKINILFVNEDKAGVNYYRTTTPAKELQRQYGDEFHVDIIPNPDFDDIDFLKKYQIIHFHRTLDQTYEKIDIIKFKLKKLGIKMVMDLDDYWELSKHHPLYTQVKRSELDKKIKHNLKISDYVTTTTPYFASEIKKLNKNVVILPNAVSSRERQWKAKKSDSQYMDFGILCGSSHLNDLKQLRGVTDKLENTSSCKGKFKYYLVGYDLRGKNRTIRLNEEFVKVMQERGLWTNQIQQQLNKINWEIQHTNLPEDIKQKFANRVLIQKEEKVKPKSTVWWKYEQILRGTNNKLGLSDEYIDFLEKFENKKYKGVENERFERVFTKPVTSFGTGYHNFDVGLAPINDVRSPYNRAKSNLKIVENGIHKNAVIVSDIDCYNEIEDGKTGLVVKDNRPNSWYKAMKKCINNPSLVEDMSEALYEYVSEKYDITKSIKQRADFYKSIVD